MSCRSFARPATQPPRRSATTDSSTRPSLTGTSTKRSSYCTHSHAEIDHDVISAIDYLARAGAQKIGILGFSMGATIALLAAANAPVAAAVSFYGGGIRSARWPGIAPGIELAAGICAPWIGFYEDL